MPDRINHAALRTRTLAVANQWFSLRPVRAMTTNVRRGCSKEGNTRMLRAWIITSIVAAMAAAGTWAASAQADGLEARHRDWGVYVHTVDRDRVCYAATSARDSTPRNTDHPEVTAVVSSWRSGVGRERPQITFGFAPRPQGPTRIRVGRELWSAYTVGQDAYVDDQDEAALVRAMRRGSVMRVETVRDDGVRVSYEFSLSGVTAALRDVGRRCG